jgi:hypothetical protein
MLVYLMGIWSILLPFGIFYGYLVYFPRFGMLYQEKSGNPVDFVNFFGRQLRSLFSDVSFNSIAV